MTNTASNANKTTGDQPARQPLESAYTQPVSEPQTDQTVSEGSQPYQRCAISPWFVGKLLGCIIASLVLIGAMANYAIYNVVPDPEHPIADVLKRFDLGHEPSIPAFYSAIIMLAAAATAAFLSVYDNHAENGRRFSWRLLTLVLVLLAIDEVVMFHEMGTAAMEQLGLNGQLYFSWVIPGSIFAAVVGISFTKLLLTLGWRTRSLFVASGAIFLSGAVGMELIAGVIFAGAESELEALSSVSHVLSQAVEEGLEMIGMALFLCTLLDLINIEGISIWVSGKPNHEMEKPNAS